MPRNTKLTKDALAILENRDLLENLLARCQIAIEDRFLVDQKRYGIAAKLEAFNVAQRLIKTSVMLAETLGGGKPEFTHRIVVEHHTPDKNPKTIKPVPPIEEPQD